MYIAEGEGFEPPEALTSTVFKTAAIDHSAIPPDNNSCFKIECKDKNYFGKKKHYFASYLKKSFFHRIFVYSSVLSQSIACDS